MEERDICSESERGTMLARDEGGRGVERGCGGKGRGRTKRTRRSRRTRTRGRAWTIRGRRATMR
eukprot:1606265-Pyramimonas_sp.AAC.1